MKIPKKVKRYCRKCKAHTEHKVSIMGGIKQRGTLRRGSLKRAKKRGIARGMGNKGRWGSKPAVSKWKRKSKSTQKKVLLYKCSKCGKSSQKKKSIRTGRLMLEDKK